MSKSFLTDDLTICHPFVIHLDDNMTYEPALANRDLAIARKRWPSQMNTHSKRAIRELTEIHQLSIASGDLIILENNWYITHTGLLRLARRSKCFGIHIEQVPPFSDPSLARWAFKATVYTPLRCRGFVGYGDAEPSNVFRRSVFPRVGCPSRHPARVLQWQHLGRHAAAGHPADEALRPR